jgi:hypothetical protein
VPIDMSDRLTARLVCGCTLGFKTGVEGSPVTVVLERKSDTCSMPSHVAGLPVFDHREALRPSTRLLPAQHPDYEEG